ncbi:unnamed protein product [Clavelina lepadiformis]|uniref:Glypican-6 n=1 Tax=Clavelina lepadiformis TaxID=159417 RepID=A0ABP0G9D4_CLALP
MRTAFVFIITFSINFALSNGELAGGDHCMDTQVLFMIKGFNKTTPSKAIRGEMMEFCPKEYTCCTQEMEVDFKSHALHDFGMKIAMKSEAVKTTFSKKSQEINVFFKELVENSQQSLDELFFKTYGDLYTENSEAFTELFQQLKSYYKGASVDMADIFDSFFTTVMQKVFAIMNKRHLFNDEYLQCIADNMNTAKPFADIPGKLSTQVQRAFIAAKSFAEGLEAGKQFAYSVAQFYPTSECASALMKMSFCSACQGYTSVKPCHGYCMNVMKGCLVEYNELNHVWNKYIHAMKKVLDRLDGPFNIELVLGQMDIDISNAIMLVQENKNDVTDLVFIECGEPPLNPNYTFTGLGGFPSLYTEYDAYPENPPNLGFGSYLQESDHHGNDEDKKRHHSSRKTRSLENEEQTPRHSRRKNTRRNVRGRKKSRDFAISEKRPETTLDETRYDYSEEQDRTEEREYLQVPTAAGTNLGALVKDVRTSIHESKNHWKMIPHHVCLDEAEEDSSATCWNGHTQGEYQHPVVMDGFHNNPEVVITSQKPPNHVIKGQITSLKNTIEMLNSAYRGFDPHLVDNDDEVDTYEPSGDNSGDGSGEVEAIETEPRSRDPDLTCPTCGGSTPSFNVIALSSALLVALRLVVQ